MANSADPDQLASSETNWSGSTLFAQEGHIQVQHAENIDILSYLDAHASFIY